jgi:hypothetical protein
MWVFNLKTLLSPNDLNDLGYDSPIPSLSLVREGSLLLFTCIHIPWPLLSTNQIFSHPTGVSVLWLRRGILFLFTLISISTLCIRDDRFQLKVGFCSDRGYLMGLSLS